MPIEIGGPGFASSGSGDVLRATSPTVTTPKIAEAALTAGAMTHAVSARVGLTLHRFDWTNAMIVALGAALTGDIIVCTLPAKTMMARAFIVLGGAAAGVTTLTVAVGRTAALYVDYIVASDAKAAANVIYGNAVAALGTNLTGYDLPSFTATTNVVAHFISTVANLDQVTGSTGSVYLETITLP